MSQIVSAFAVPSSALPEVEQHLNADDWNGFWERVHPFEVEVDFPYNGYVVVVFVEYLRERGIELPVSRDPVVQPLVERCAPLVCANRLEATAAAATLAGVSVSDDALAAYWRDFTGDEEFEAGTAMRAALDWLRQVFAAGQEADWCIILEG
jgi:hypothetical protein